MKLTRRGETNGSALIHTQAICNPAVALSGTMVRQSAAVCVQGIYKRQTRTQPGRNDGLFAFYSEAHMCKSLATHSLCHYKSSHSEKRCKQEPTHKSMVSHVGAEWRQVTVWARCVIIHANSFYTSYKYTAGQGGKGHWRWRETQTVKDWSSTARKQDTTA